MLQVLIHDHEFPEIWMSYRENRELMILIGEGKSECLVTRGSTCGKMYQTFNYH